MNRNKSTNPLHIIGIIFLCLLPLYMTLLTPKIYKYFDTKESTKPYKVLYVDHYILGDFYNISTINGAYYKLDNYEIDSTYFKVESINENYIRYIRK